MDVYAIIAEILAAKYEVAPADVAPEAQFADLGLDSLVLAELSVILTSRLGFEVGEEELTEARSIGAAAEALQGRAVSGTEATTV